MTEANGPITSSSPRAGRRPAATRSLFRPWGLYGDAGHPLPVGSDGTGSPQTAVSPARFEGERSELVGVSNVRWNRQRSGEALPDEPRVHEEAGCAHPHVGQGPAIPVDPFDIEPRCLLGSRPETNRDASRPMHSTGLLGATDSSASTPISLILSAGSTTRVSPSTTRTIFRLRPTRWQSRPPEPCTRSNRG